jgi:hypothetical protein
LFIVTQPFRIVTPCIRIACSTTKSPAPRSVAPPPVNGYRSCPQRQSRRSSTPQTFRARSMVANREPKQFATFEKHFDNNQKNLFFAPVFRCIKNTTSATEAEKIKTRGQSATRRVLFSSQSQTQEYSL